MRTLTASQRRLLQRKDLTEVYLFDISLNGGGPTLNLSTQYIIVGGTVYQPYVVSHSGITRRASMVKPQSKNPDIRIELANAQYRQYPNLSMIDSVYTFTWAPITARAVYIDPKDGSQSDPEIKFVGRVECIDEETYETFTLGVSHLSSYLDKCKVQTIIDQTTYPYADPKDMGKPVPQIFGSVKNVPLKCVRAGGSTKLIADCFSNDVKFYVALAPTEPIFPGASGLGQLPTQFPFQCFIKDELVEVTGAGSDSIGDYFSVGSTGNRGLAYYKYVFTAATGQIAWTKIQTVAVDHPIGSAVYERRSDFKYLACDVDALSAVEAITAVRVNNMLAVANVVKTLSDPAYGGMATVEFTEQFVEDRAASLLLDDAYHNHELSTDQLTYSYTLYINTYLVVPPDAGFQFAINGVPFYRVDPNNTHGGNIGFSGSFVGSIAGDILTISFQQFYGTACTDVAFNFKNGPSGQLNTRSGNGLTNQATTTPVPNSSGVYPTPLSWPLTAIAVEAAASNVSLGGSTAADRLVGGVVTADIQGYTDKTGVITGTAGELIQNPAHTIKKLLMRAGLLASEIGASFATTAGLLAAQIANPGYQFNFAYLEAIKTQQQETRAGTSGSKSTSELVDELAMQARCVFYWDEAGMAQLAFVPTDPPEPLLTIDDGDTEDGFHFGRTSENDIYNDWLVYFNYIYSSNDYRHLEGSWAGSKKDSDAPSQAKYATQAGVPAVFHKRYDLWATTSAAQAADYLALRKVIERGQMLTVEFVAPWYAFIIPGSDYALDVGDTFAIGGTLYGGCLMWVNTIEDAGDGFWKCTASSWPGQLQAWKYVPPPAPKPAPPGSQSEPFTIGESGLGGSQSDYLQ